MSDGRRVDRGKVGEFLALAFGISWAGALAIYLSRIEFGTALWSVLVVVGVMWGPAAAAIVVQRRRGESIGAGCGLRIGRPRWVLLAAVAPIALLAGTIAVGAAIPGVSISTDYGAYLLEQGLSEAEVEEALSQVEAAPGPPIVFLVVTGLLAGVTVNAVAALGEELGWRGLLLAELSPLGFWRLSLLTGVAWGIWHAPIIVQGYNFPEAPLAGVAVMTAATVALSPAYTYLTVRARSVLAATFFHGAFNALGGLAVVYLAGAGNLLTAPVGAAGIGAGILAAAACVLHDRYAAEEPITTGRPLSPWE